MIIRSLAIPGGHPDARLDRRLQGRAPCRHARLRTPAGGLLSQVRSLAASARLLSRSHQSRRLHQAGNHGSLSVSTCSSSRTQFGPQALSRYHEGHYVNVLSYCNCCTDDDDDDDDDSNNSNNSNNNNNNSKNNISKNNNNDNNNSNNNNGKDFYMTFDDDDDDNNNSNNNNKNNNKSNDFYMTFVFIERRCDICCARHLRSPFQTKSSLWLKAGVGLAFLAGLGYIFLRYFRPT